MRILQTSSFQKDISKLDGFWRERLFHTLQQLSGNPEKGKAMKGLPGIFSERMGPFRLIYQVRSKKEILLMHFKNRDEAYRYLSDRQP